MLMTERADKNGKRLLRFLVLAPAGAVWVAMATLIAGCPGVGPDANLPSENARDCVGCHTDQALLEAVADPVEQPPADTGEG
ncbi:MAG: hypothetical protein JXQ75_06345 [Phycisphaerae bacterium]|nr:hypothetical protein [Phycisphaerae bacterium]